jgi:two-component system LytT family sensor kinase
MSLSGPATPASMRFSLSSMRQGYSRQLAVSLLCWAVIVALESGQVFAADAVQGYVLSSVHYVAWAVFNWYALALLTPVIYQLGLRYPIAGPNWGTRIFVPHLAACIGCMCVQAIARGFAGWIYTLSYEQPASAIALTFEWAGKRGTIAFIAYWIIVIVAGFAHLREEVRQRELRQANLESRLASAELEKLRMQIQPHFLFNTLQAAITLVQEDSEAAEDVLLRLSQLLRISLDQMDTNEIPLARELEFLDLYTGIQRRRFGDRLSVEIRADDNTLQLPVPPLILQPLVENAIHHGIGKHKGEDLIEIFARIEGRDLQIEVWNGNSVVEESGERLFLRGVGLRNTRARLEQLYGPTAYLHFRSLARGGAAVLIHIPLKTYPSPASEPAVQTAP